MTYRTDVTDGADGTDRTDGIDGTDGTDRTDSSVLTRGQDSKSIRRSDLLVSFYV